MPKKTLQVCVLVCVLLTCVCSYVPLKQPGPGEGLPAEFTHTGKRVRPDVHLQCSQADVLLRAVLAVEVLLAAPLTPELLALGRTREPQVLVVTVRAPESLAAVVGAGGSWEDSHQR